MTRYFLALTLLTATTLAAQAQQEGPTPTQALVAVDAKNPTVPTISDVTIKVNNRATQLTNLTPVQASGAQVAILIDDGLRMSMARELPALRDFVKGLRPGTEAFVGYMQNGRIINSQGFTTDLNAVADDLRIPVGSPGLSASPYFCLSDFVKRWPENASSTPKARFVLMITNGVDPYNGSTSITNQNSPYVDAAVKDAQRAGVAVYSMYYSDAGIRGGRASFSGQSYLAQIAQGTGGTAYYQGVGNPVSMEPYLKQFQKAISETYVASFMAPGGKGLVQLKVSTKLPKTKLNAPEYVNPGTQIQQ
ncbi:hypothetical protein [Edaphobacter dinghuensis]|uniref:VWFA-related protein n=1 Tax=Edaphobacter dinghuensis TaxID=1560005 RepID=A0A917M368_9BACT|nr:hypothetical protein [Edaphobacter dinghuensis]GGG76249.1 hypothetical protein GCM10011585_18950 [Edaphobacter dinghuensis]